MDAADVAIVGTGLAALIAARRLESEGHQVLVLNPDHDFFTEDSELSMDPLWPGAGGLTPAQVLKSSPEAALEILRPEYPGAVELWPGKGMPDPSAPTLRSRTRLWVGDPRRRDWENLETFYVEASDAGLKPQLHEGLTALRRVPAVSPRALALAQSETAAPLELSAVSLPKVCDVDAVRYRNGLLEFLRERLGPERLIVSAQVELTATGVRYLSESGGKRIWGNTRLRQALLVFWTPRLTHWIEKHAEIFDRELIQPRGFRVWEEWRLLSREPVDPSVVGVVRDCLLWADCEGTPEGHDLRRLSVLRRGKLAAVGDRRLTRDWAASQSFEIVSELCHDFLKWERLTVRGLKPRVLMEWEGDPPLLALSDQEESGFGFWVAGGADGPAIDVVNRSRKVCELLL